MSYYNVEQDGPFRGSHKDERAQKLHCNRLVGLDLQGEWPSTQKLEDSLHNPSCQSDSEREMNTMKGFPQTHLHLGIPVTHCENSFNRMSKANILGILVSFIKNVDDRFCSQYVSAIES